MNNYYELIYLNQELRENLTGGSFEFSLTPHKNVLETFIACENVTYRMIFSTNPDETALFLDDFRPPKKSNAAYFFEPLKNKKILKVNLAHLDRLITFSFEDGFRLIFKIYGSRPNVFLADEVKIIDAFKNPDKWTGKQPPQPMQPEFAETVSAEAKTKNQLTRLNPLLPRHLIPELIRAHNLEDKSPEEIGRFVDGITKKLLNEPVFRVLVTGEVCLWSDAVLPVETDRRFDCVNDCIRYAYRTMVHQRRLSRKKEQLIERLEQSHDKLKARLQQLLQADKSLERADDYEKYGHLLMANAHRKLQGGTKQLVVQDFYNDNEELQIPVKDQWSVAENAEHYYEKAADARKAYEQAKKRVGGVKQRLRQVKGLLEELHAMEKFYELEKWVKAHEEELEKFGWGGDDSAQVTSPFRKLKAGRYEVWIGKNAKSNDELTSRAHKEDIWLHARGVGGSHVVIRMGNVKEYPPKPVILQAAGWAAWYSKASGSKTAPVMYTKRKYVRKPKGAPPGAVVVEHEQVVMVPPVKPESLSGA